MDPTLLERDRCIQIVQSQLDGTRQLATQRVLTRVINLINRGDIPSPSNRGPIPSTPSELMIINAIVEQETARCKTDKTAVDALNRTLQRIKTEAFGESEGRESP